MIIIKCDQRDATWFAERMGIPTASRFSDIVTPTCQERKGERRETYIHELVAERMTETTQEHYVSAAMERGTILEDEARRWYELRTGRTVTQVGVVFQNKWRKWACSPDGLWEDRGMEIKCPLRQTIVKYLIDGKPPGDHMIQMQAGMWITGLEKWDYVLYTDEQNIPSVIWTVEREEKFMSAFDKFLQPFCEEVEAMLKLCEKYKFTDMK